METQKTSVKHTAGPWTVEDPMKGEWWIVQANANLAFYEWRTIAIASVPQGNLEEGFPQEVVEANARLIAAAPQLLEALKALLDITLFSSTDKDFRIYREAKAAIAKAEGPKNENL